MRCLQGGRGPMLAAVLVTVLSDAMPAAAASGSAPTLEGDWEAVIADPKRPWHFVIHLKPAAAPDDDASAVTTGPRWTASASVPGFGDFPLGAVEADGPQIRFRFPAVFDSAAFAGTRASADSIAGQVTAGGESWPTRLTRAVPLPRPANRLEAWEQDLDFATRAVLDWDRSFAPPARDAFRQAMSRLRADLPNREDAQILVGLSRAVALADNPHTWLRPSPTRDGAFTTTLPIRMWWFAGGLHVVRAAESCREALRARVVAIDGHSIDEARTKVASLIPGPAPWVDYLSPVHLRTPDVLYGAGIASSREGATFTLEDEHGRRFDLEIRAEPLDRGAMAGESWQELSPVVPTGRPPWVTALAAPTRRPAATTAPTPAADAPDLPLYLRRPLDPYWFDFDAGRGLLYVQLNHAGDADEGPTFAQFGDSLLAFAHAHRVRDVVLDLRFNSGGNLQVGKAFFRRLADDETIDRPGHLFVITGRTTFSAGLYHAAQLRQFTRAIFVGEPVGDRLEFWAEGGRIVLPNSQAVIAYSNGFHGYAGIDRPGHRPYYEELSVKSLDPDLPAPLSARDYFAGRDPAMEAIRARIESARSGPASGS